MTDSRKVLQNSGDLHIHSRWSDGSLDVEHLIYLAAKRGIKYISITDHDFLHDFDSMRSFGEKYGVYLIFGVELSCMDYKRGRKVHVLCYNPKKPEILEPVCSEVLKSREESGKKIVSSIIEKYDVIPSLIEKYKSKSGCFFETNILHALAECGYSNVICGEFYNKVFKGDDKFNFHHTDVWEMLELIRKAEGKSILAHPSVHNSFELLDDLVLKKSIDGVEVWHPKNDNVESEKLYNIVKTNNLIATGGTDFHGLYGSSVVRIGDYHTPHLYIERILK